MRCASRPTRAGIAVDAAYGSCPGVAGREKQPMKPVRLGNAATRGLRVLLIGWCALTASLAVAATSTAVEYFHSGYGHYFVTALPQEVAALDTGVVAGWSRTGESFGVFDVNTTGAANVCRFWSGQSYAPKSSHFYTPFAWECAIVKGDPNWQSEGEGFAMNLADAAGACASGTVPLYRLYNKFQGGAPNHRYTTSETTRSQMLAQGWVAEGTGIGVIGCVPPAPVTIVAAGDIAQCHHLPAAGSVAAKTAALVTREDVLVLTLGDHAYEYGTPAEFADCFQPTWGAFKSRIRPSPGNHDYYTTDAEGYYGYFGAQAGPDRRGYYSFDYRGWHFISLNSLVDVSGPVAAVRLARVRSGKNQRQPLHDRLLALSCVQLGCDVRQRHGYADILRCAV